MRYQLDKNKSVEKNIQSLAVEQIDRGIAEINDQSLEVHESIHQVRKRCKKIRGLIRLVRKAFPDYKEENAFFRDTARKLSDLRDSQSLIDIFNKLMQRPGCQSEQEAMKPVSTFLEERQQKLMDEADVYKLLQETELTLREGKRRARAWQLEENGFEAIRGGLKKTYKRGRKAMPAAYEEPTTEKFHEWRKRVKYHWYHARLITPMWEKVLKAYAAEVHLLADYLGDDHDLSLLSQHINEHEDVLGNDERQLFNSMLEKWQAELRNSARNLGTRIFNPKPKFIKDEVAAFWPAWKEGNGLHILNK